MLRHLVQAHQRSQQHRRGRYRRRFGRQISKPSPLNQSLRSAVKLDLGVVVHRGHRTDRFHLQLELVREVTQFFRVFQFSLIPFIQIKTSPSIQHNVISKLI